jgi:hypothetical protein
VEMIKTIDYITNPGNFEELLNGEWYAEVSLSSEDFKRYLRSCIILTN